MTKATPMGSLPDVFVKGPGTGLQLFFHGMCAFVLPAAKGDPLRVAMLNAYPNDKPNQHRATLLVPRGAVDLAKSTAAPAAVDAHHVIYALNDVAITVDVSGLMKPEVKVKNDTVGAGCAAKGNWDNAGWALRMGDLSKLTPLAWNKVGTVSQAQFETLHGSLEQDFDQKEMPSELDTNEWNINGTIRPLKQSLRLRIKEPGPISLVLTPRSGGKATAVVLTTDTGTVNAGILNLPARLKPPTMPKDTRLKDALAYYQMYDPSPLNKGNDDTLPVPLWTDNPDACSTKMSPECMCCPPGIV
jgi:hypothetical protein